MAYRLLLPSVCAIFLFPFLALAQSQYTLTDLGPALTVGGINPQGARSVGSISATGFQAPAYFTARGPQVLAPEGRADGIYQDMTVGYTSNGPINQEAFLHHPWFGIMLLGILPGGSGSAATAINPRGAVVGYGDNANGRVMPLLWARGQRTILPVPSGGDGFADAISPQGRIVGACDVAPGESTVSHGCYWWAGRVDDMGTLGGAFSIAVAVNDTPMAAGWSSIATGGQVPMTWTPSGGMVALPTLPGFPFGRARAMNANDVIVGACDPRGFDPSHACRWGRARRVVDLNTMINVSGWLLEEAGGINTSGQIAGIGRLNGISHAFLLTPQAENMARK